jgi:predicted phosphodiesterase
MIPPAMRLVCLSDTHNLHARLSVPDGDVLVHAGDATMQGSEGELRRFADWLRGLPHRRKVVVAGNHDWLCERQPGRAAEILEGLDYLLDSAVEIGGLRFWGSPWQPWFLSWAFNLPRGEALQAKWDLIPPATDVLVTHGPPRGLLDEVETLTSRVLNALSALDGHVGCAELRATVEALAPRVHVFGHIHEGYGQRRERDTLYVNASCCDRRYRPVNAPIVVDLD